jgi:dihydrofolate synthase/folylpolyglutamate synthase
MRRGEDLMRAPDRAYLEALRYLSAFEDLERRPLRSATIGLDRTRALLAALGHPEQRYPSVLIAGTKGKGSTAAVVERALRAAGYRTGLYTQPHLHTIRERIRVDGELIAEEELTLGVATVRRAVEAVCTASSPTTAYEIVTSLALDHFAAAGVDVAVLEVGLGGRLDATNVVDARVSAITSISLDHTQILGDTVEAIAAEKADIIKVGRPAVSAPQPAGAMHVIRSVAQARNALLFVVGENGATWSDATLSVRSGAIPNLQPALYGEHQRINAAVAATILDALHHEGPIQVPLKAIRTGIEDVAWPGRFEVVSETPTIVVDGAHNVASAERLDEALQARFGDLEPVYVLGMAADKDAEGIVRALSRARRIVATRAHHPRALDPARIAQLAREYGVESVAAEPVAEALRVGRLCAGADGVVVATGSLYIVAEAREALGLAEPSGEATFNPWATR